MKLKYYTGSQVIDILYSCLDYMQAYEVIKKLAVEPSADVVEVVRCKDCEHWSKEFKACYIHDFCEIFQSDYYCASGERMEDV